MLKLGPRHLLCETAADLPAPRPGQPVYLDCETRSRDDTLRSAGGSPYQGDRACMWSVAFDDDGPAVAVPYRMRDGRNLPEDVVTRWLGSVLSAASEWRNHNVKFDAHFAHVDGCPVPQDLTCTLTMAKLIDSDRMSHGLKELSRDWLDVDYASEDRVAAYLDGYRLPRGAKAKDYALVPTDVLGFYACDDVLYNRDLYRHCDRLIPADVRPTWDVERRLTPALWDMENLGLRTDERELKLAKAKSVVKQIRLATRLNELTGTEFTDSSKYSYALICGAWGLPVLSRNKKSGNPSFDADALRLYLSYPDVAVDPVKRESVELMLALRAEETFCSLFVDSFLEKRDARGYVHSSYNQIIRTGRMSCKDPNAQQFDVRAKQLVLADGPGMGFLDLDFSQIEFRIIVHYIRDEEAIRAYRENPDTDFHAWVAELCGIKRKPAKTVNFATAYGAGKKNIVGQLAANEDVMAEIGEMVTGLEGAARLKEFARLCWERGEKIFRTYHERLPNLEPTSKRAAKVARDRGYVFNAFGRRRHLPPKAAHVAFNTLCQGTAMDYIKRRMIDTAHRYWPEMAADGVTMRINVHDAVVYHGPVEVLAAWRDRIVERLQKDEPCLRVPMRCEGEIHPDRWLEAV